MKHLVLAIFVIITAMSKVAVPTEQDKYNVVWDSPSADARGSMPIGNGDIGLNVWVEPSGDLCFFISKTDAWDENERLLKLNKVRVKFEPALNVKNNFRWELKLRDGAIEIQDGKTQVRVWVDANHPVIQVDAKCPSGVSATAVLEPWRTTKRSLGSPQSKSKSYTEYFATAYTSLPAVGYPDTMLPRTPKQIGWYHRNVDSPWLPSLKLQKLDAIARTEKDPILNRTIGGIVSGDGFASVSDTELKTDKPADELSLRIHVLTQITDTPEQWLASLEKQAATTEKIPEANRWQEHCQWWNEFWNRSWIYAEGNQSLVMPVNKHPWRVGVASDGGSRFGGKIVDPQVSSRALLPDEIAALTGKLRTDSSSPPGEVSLTSGCTIAAWIKPVAGDAGRILDKCTAGKSDGLTLDAYPGLSLRWNVGGLNMFQPNCLKAGEWQHVAATADATTGARCIYLNGKLIKEERDNSTAETATRGYTLQRWINACGGRGAFPIKFNGSIFVVDNTSGVAFPRGPVTHDADYRAWGGGYWFQNTRLPYWTMLASGDFDLMRPLFNMYMKALPARKLAAKTYYGHGGAFFPETITFWGNYLDQGNLGYGTNRIGKPDGLTDNQYIRRYWQGGIELVALMLDYYDLTQDKQFRDETLVPLATEIIRFYDEHWKRGANGKILFHPSQSLETWWDCTNPLPDVAGLHYVIPRLQQITGAQQWQKTLDDLPPVPVSTDGKRLLPAEKFANKRNYENPELYAVFPYRLYGVGKSNLEVGRATFAARRHPENRGWQQNSIQAALLGITEMAQRYVVDSTSTHASGFRFPAMWGPNYDWTPDQDHGSVMVNAIQRMLIQYDGDKILVLPAWPKEWNVNFKLHAPRQTTITGMVKNGKVLNLVVTPESRRPDVSVCAPFTIEKQP